MTKKSKSLVFFGNEKLATGIQQPKRYILEAVQNIGFDVEQVIKGKVSDLKPHKSQIAVLAAFGQIIPSSILNEFPLGIINVHPSLLPAYRGPTPIEQAMLEGATSTGVSIMKLTTQMDEGPIYKQKMIHLSAKEIKEDLVDVLQRLGADLISQVLPAIYDGKIKARAQPHPIRASYSKKIFKIDGAINWDKSATQIEREIRAYSGWPGSYTKLKDTTVTVTKAEIAQRVEAEAGVFFLKDRGLYAGCGTDALKILELKPAGKRNMTAQDFINGYKKLLV